uniref:Calmodulin n=1 Tax=Micromonas pusilla TaxID=38833 RepID=A0A7S0KW69_MICPS|mmetsp:Transcript_9322/g.36242  ORF Transcript_9322/g.36242 Transcript_9322/m.36242 type:complete len:1199 (+) Transcript_9322:200-3796(+)
MVIAGVVQDHPSRRGAHRALSMADEEIGWKAKARAWVDESDSDSDNDEGSRKPHRGAHVSAAKGPYVYRRFMYISDSYLSQAKYQTYALMFLAVVITVGGGVGYSFSEEGVTLEDGMYAVFTWLCAGVLSSGTSAPIEIVPRVVANTLVVMGILYFSTMLGLVVEAVQAKMQALREGKSVVVERGHSVMLGWTEKSLLFVKEIINANESEGGGVIVVLCKEGKEQMEKELNLFIKKADLKGTSVVFRQGSRLMIGDLDKVSVSTARSVVVFSDTTMVPDQADAEILQVILNLNNMSLSGHVVAEVRDKDNEALIHLIGRGNVETVVSHDIIGRLMLMAVRQPGLAEVYGSILGFEGDEFYTEHWPQLVGTKWKDVQLMLPEAVPIGIRNSKNGEITLNPSHDHVMTERCELVVIAEDNDTYAPKQRHRCDPGAVPILENEEDEKEYILFAGWRRDLRDILLLLDAMCAPGSEIHIMASVPLSDRDALLSEGGLEVDSLRNISLIHHVGNTAMRRHLEYMGIEKFTSCIIFADEEEEGDIMQSDSKCLATLLLIRDIQNKHKKLREQGFMAKSTVKRAAIGGTREDDTIPIVTEILDPRTQQTIKENPEMRAVSDFLQSNDMVSKILAMVCEDRSVKTILDQMLAPRGATVACIPASRYVLDDEELSFFQMACRCQEFGETLLGYLEPDESESTGFKAPEINSKEKKKPMVWNGYVCAVLTGGPAVDALMSQRSKYMDTSFAKKMGLGLSSVLDVDDDEFEVLCMDAFKRYDDDDSGSLELPEILEAFKSLPALSHATEDVVVAKFKKFDADNSGALDAEEFMELMKQLRAEKTMSRMMEVGEEEFEKLLQESFKKFDDDNSGELELDEIIAAFDLLPLTEVSEDDVRAKFTRFDADHSGALDFEEFTEMMRELRAQDAKAASVKKVRLDAAERRIIRNLVSMAEVKLCKLVPAERERACAKILAWVNNAKIQDVADLMRGMSKTGSAVNLKGMNARDTPEPPTPRDGASGAVTRGGGRLPSPRGGVGGRALAPAPSSLGSTSLPPVLRPPSHAPTGGGMDSKSQSKDTSPTSTLEASGAISHRGGIVGANGIVAPRVPGQRTPRSFTETSEYAQYISERLVGMPAMRRNQVVQIVDMLSDAFACGQSVPATRLLGVISSFQSMPRDRDGGAGGAGGGPAAMAPGGPGPFTPIGRGSPQ